MGVVNICLGAFVEKDCRDMTNLLYEKMKSELAAAGVDYGVFDLLTNKSMITGAVAGNKYDVVICMENLCGDSLGAGTIREWKGLNPRLKIALIITKKKKGGKKLLSLYQYGYYNAIYHEEISGVTLRAIIEKARTKEEAFAYYGLGGSVEEADVAPQGGAVSSINKEAVAPAVDSTEQNVGGASASGAVVVSAESEAVIEEPAAVAPEGKEEKATVAEVVEDVSLDEGTESFEDVLKSMDKLFEDDAFTEEPVDDTFSSWDSEKQDEPLFGGDDIFRNTAANRVPGDDAMGERILRDYREEEKEMMSNPFPGVKPVQVSSLVPTGNFASYTSSLKGIIREIVDEQLLLVSMSDTKGIEDIDSLSFLLLVHTGRKGYVEDGKYKASTLSLKAYGNCVIDEGLVLLEVPDRDLVAIENSISGKECSLIVKKL